MSLPWILCAVLLVLSAALLLKLLFLKRNLKDMCEMLDEHLSQQTNTLLSISSSYHMLKRFTAELNSQLRRLRQQRRQFTNGNHRLKNAVTAISHDLRTPLTAICGYLDLLDSEEKSMEAERYLRILRNRVEQLVAMTEELFHFSVTIVSENDKEEFVVLNEALEDCIAGFYAVLKANQIEPVIHLPQKKVVRKLNPLMLSRVFTNLMNNALKYSDGDLDIRLSETGDITFTNTAFNLDPIQVARLFDRFYTVHHAEKSTGLGLEISRTLLERMNGTITAEYLNQKLCIQIKLPETDKK